MVLAGGSLCTLRTGGTMSELYELTVAQAQHGIRTGDVSAVALAEALRNRIEPLEPTLKAWVTIDREEVLSTARERDQEREKGGLLGPLHGIPVGLKDIFYTAGMKTTACSKIYADFVPTYDATSVARLKEAGGSHPGQGRHDRVRLRRPFSNPQSVEPGPHTWRLQQRLVSCRGHADGPCRPWHPDRRVYMQARVLQWDRGPQAFLR